ncbi:MAG: YbaN family protein [Ignavibacteriaceae bacterium]|nr:YbaN family protein [Ignavibacteriaceae bacterium]
MRHTIKHGKVAAHPVTRGVFLTLGFISALIGLSGLVLPFVPGVLFMIIAAYFFARSSEKFHQWLLNNKYFGHHLTAFANGAKMPTRAKVMTVLIIAISITIGILFF